MTTILYCPKTKALYADSLMISGSGRVSSKNATKLFRHEDRVMGMSGAPDMMARYLNAIKKDGKPPVGGPKHRHSILSLYDDGRLTEAIATFDYAEIELCRDEYHALGSGTPYVIAAAITCNDPIRSMEVAMELDTSSDGKIFKGYWYGRGERVHSITEMIRGN